MRVLVACEESQVVCIAFRERGHEAYSCDIQECSGGHPEWHIHGDMLPLLNGRCKFETMDGKSHEIIDRWDMIIAFVPCTKTSNAGARHLYKGGILNIPRYYEGMCGKALFMSVWMADCDKIAIENPVPSKIFEYPKPSQVIQPYMFGHEFTKKTLLWEKGLCHLCLLASLCRTERGVRQEAIPGSMMRRIEGCLREIVLKTGQKLSPELPKQWLSSGEI